MYFMSLLWEISLSSSQQSSCPRRNSLCDSGRVWLRIERCKLQLRKASKLLLAWKVYMVLSQNRGPQYRPIYIIVLHIGTPKRVPLILGNPHIGWGAVGYSQLWEEDGPRGLQILTT